MTRGRPRDSGLDARIRAAALDLVMERGVEGTTMDAVAERAGVGKASVYRRWAAKDDLVLDALDELVRAEIPVPDTGDLRTDLTRGLRDLLRFAATPVGGHLLDLLAESPRNPALARIQQRVWDRQLALAALPLSHARARGELPADVTDETVLDLLIGPVLARRVTGRPVPPEKEAASIVDLLLHGLASR